MKYESHLARVPIPFHRQTDRQLHFIINFGIEFQFSWLTVLKLSDDDLEAKMSDNTIPLRCNNGRITNRREKDRLVENNNHIKRVNKKIEFVFANRERKAF